MNPKSGPIPGLESARRAALCLAVPLALATAPAHAEGNIVIKDFVLTHAIEGREPIDIVEAFTPHDDRGFAFLRVFNDGPPADLTAVWIHEGSVHANVDLSVGTSSGWRTWSSVNLKPGQWTVHLRDDQGVVLAERSFAVVSEFAETTQDALGDGMAPAGERFDDGWPQEAQDWPPLEGATPSHGDDLGG